MSWPPYFYTGDTPTIDEDLRANLLSQRSAIRRDTPRLGRRETLLFKIVKGRMLSGNAIPSPPKDGALLDDLVQPRLSNLFAGEVRIGAVLLQRAHKGKRPRDIVVDDNERRVEFLVDVVLDGAELGGDVLIGPVLEGPAEVDAD